MTKTTLVVLAALAAAACGRSPTPAQSVAELRSPDSDVRRAAADDLRHIGPPATAVPHLLAALEHEQNPYTYGALLLALGKAGAPEALPYICGGLHSSDSKMAGWSDKALRLWEEKNGGSCPPPGAPAAAVFPGAPPASASAIAGPPAPPDWQPASAR